jgi:hypothetical protein
VAGNYRAFLCGRYFVPSFQATQIIDLALQQSANRIDVGIRSSRTLRMSALVVYPFEKQLGLPDLHLRFSEWPAKHYLQFNAFQ